MFLKAIITSVILVAIIMLALGVKILFDKNAEFTIHSCSLVDDESPEKGQVCSSCGLNEMVDCQEITKKN